MKENNQKSKGFRPCEIPKRAVTTITITLFLIFACASCGIKSNSPNSNQLKKGNENFVTFKFRNQKAWLELKNLLAKDLMSSKELNVIDCSKLESNSVNTKLRLLEDVQYYILESNYSWNTYQINNTLCIKIHAFNGFSEFKPFFLNIEDTRFLLSASKSYHFKKLGLRKSNIISKTTYFVENSGAYCGGTTIKHLKDKIIYSSDCKETIRYIKFNNL